MTSSERKESGFLELIKSAMYEDSGNWKMAFDSEGIEYESTGMLHHAIRKALEQVESDTEASVARRIMGMAEEEYNSFNGYEHYNEARLAEIMHEGFQLGLDRLRERIANEYHIG